MQMLQQSTQPTTLSLAQAPMPQVDQDRKRQMIEAWKAYRGEFQKPLKVVAGQPDDNAIANFCVTVVDKGVSWLFGKPVKIEATDEKVASHTMPSTSEYLRHPATYAERDKGAPGIKIAETPIQDFLDGLWGDDDDKMTLLSDAAINGGVCGQSFLKLIPPQKMMKYPRIVVLDPQIIRIVTAPDDCSLILAYIIEYPGPNDFQKRQIIARVDPDGLAGIVGEYDLDDYWTISNYIRKGHSSSWLQLGMTDEWPYPFAPIFSCKNLPNPNEAWGTQDLSQDLIDQNKSLIFLLSNLLRIVKFHGHPKTWVKGLRAGQIDVSVDGTICLESPDASIGVVTPMENFAGILSVMAHIMSNIDQQSRVPGVALGRQEQLPRLGNISGVALALMFQPLIEKTMQKQRTYGKMIREISRAALVIAGLIPIEKYEDCKIDLHWQPLLPNDNLQAAQEALLLQQLNVSMATIYAGLGLNADDEAEKKAAEDAKQLVMYSRGQGMPPMQPEQPQPTQPPQIMAQQAQPQGVLA